MEWVLAFVCFVILSVGFALVLQRQFFSILIGLTLLSQVANVLIFLSGGLVRGQAPMIAEGAEVLAAGTADPLPQALILTAIVIGFGLLAFFAAVFSQVSIQYGGFDVTKIQSSEEIES